MNAGPGVLFVSNFLAATGSNRIYSEELSDRLEGRGWRVTRTSSVPGRVMRLVDMLRTTWASRHAYSVAHVDVFSGPAFLWAEAVCGELRQIGKPFVLTLRGGNLPDFARRWPRRVRRVLRAAAFVTAPSDYLGDQLAEFRRDLSVVRNAVDISAYPFAVRSKPRARLVWVRAFHRIYNPVMAVEVLAQIARHHPDATLTMVGPDKDGSRADVERRAAELGVAHRLVFTGRVAKHEIPKYLAAADVFINTANIDNTPISVLEALAAGLCVVTTDVGGIPYLLSHEQTAMLVPPGDARAMSSAVERLLTDDELADGMSRRARDFALECDWGRVLPRWETVLQDVRSSTC